MISLSLCLISINTNRTNRGNNPHHVSGSYDIWLTGLQLWLDAETSKNSNQFQIVSHINKGKLSMTIAFNTDPIFAVIELIGERAKKAVWVT